MDGGDPDAPSQKRPRLDSVNPGVYNGLPPPPPHPPHTQPTRHPTQVSSPSQSRPYPPHSLPPPPGQPYPSQGPGPSPTQGHYPSHQPSPSLPPSDIRAYSDPRNIPSPGQRPHGAPPPPVTLPARPSSITQDSISDYSRPTVTPRPAPSDSQSSRTNSIDARHQPPMEHGGPPPWPPSEHRPNGSFSNGYPPVVSPPIPHGQQYQSLPLQQAQDYPQYASTPHMGGSAAALGAYAQAQRRKQVRATQACNHCRSRKQKCDEARPCQFCRENNYDCQYKDVPPPKQDRSMLQLQDSVNSISDTLKSFVEGFNSWKYSVEGRLPPPRGNDSAVIPSDHASPGQMYGPRASMSEQNGSRMPTPVQGRTQMHRVNSMKTESPVVPHSTMSPLPAHASTPIKQEAMLAAPQPPATPADSVRTDHTTSAGERSFKEKTGLQGDHTTPAHQILDDWPSMQTFAQEIPAIKELIKRGYKISDYPMQLEQARGLVRVWGVGEGQDLNDGAQGPGSPESNESDAPSPAAGKDVLWGPVEAPSPSTLSVGTPGESEGNVGGLGLDGNLKLDHDTLWRLHHSYHVNIHSLHPFLNPSKLRKMVKEFGDMYSPGARMVHAGIKRKRSTTGYHDAFSPAGDKNGPDPIERSLRNAIVLLILALGKVCEYKKPLPAPHPDKSNSNLVWGCTRESPSYSGNGSFSSDDGMESRPRNIDILPGMAYFSYATDILGNQQGGNTVAHAQAMLLAALYLGQFARVLESWSWINNACRVCLVLIKAEMQKISRHVLFSTTNPAPVFSPKENYRLNLVKCVYWTCLQLETDILAEMSTLPPSEISKYQEDISYPSGVFEKFPEVITFNESSDHDKTMWIYSSQIHLRVILNEAHNTLYSSGGRKKPPGFDVHNLKEVANAARVHADILLSWRRLLPAELSWEDNEPPATDINIARLRAKFYGGHYMILRPFLFLAVHEIELPPGPPVSGWSSQTSSPAATVESAPTPTHTQIHQRGAFVDLTSEQSGLLRVAHDCIASAIQSTIAFDRVGADPNTKYNRFKETPRERLILTNIFGTLHAQFGNMIVLAAVYRSRLRNHLPSDTDLTKSNLSDLYRRTIKILKEVAPNSPILKVDAEILEHVRKLLGLG